MCENTYLLSFRNKMSELWSCFRWQCNADTLYANNKKIQKDHEGFELGWNFIVRLCHRGWSSTILLTERERKKVFSSLNDWWPVTNINWQTKEKNALFWHEVECKQSHFGHFYDLFWRVFSFLEYTGLEYAKCNVLKFRNVCERSELRLQILTQ